MDQNTSNVPELLSINATVAHFGVSRGQIYRMLKDGRATAKKIGVRTYIIMDSMKAGIERLPNYESREK